MVTSGYQFMNLKFVYLSKNMPTEHQHLVMVWQQKRLQKAVQVSSILPWTSKGKNICFTELFVTILKRVVK